MRMSASSLKRCDAQFRKTKAARDANTSRAAEGRPVHIFRWLMDDHIQRPRPINRTPFAEFHAARVSPLSARQTRGWRRNAKARRDRTRDRVSGIKASE
jgi:hypothetical protein